MTEPTTKEIQARHDGLMIEDNVSDDFTIMDGLFAHNDRDILLKRLEETEEEMNLFKQELTDYREHGRARDIQKLKDISELPTKCVTPEWTGIHGQKQSCKRCIACSLQAILEDK